MEILTQLVTDYWIDFALGTWLTVQLVVISAVCGFLIAVPVALGRLSKNPLVRELTTAYSLFFRGTPLLVQIFLVYFGLGQFGYRRKSVSLEQ